MQVNPLFDNEKPRHVKSLNFSLARYEEAPKPEEANEARKFNQSTSREDHSVEINKRRNMVKVPISLGELFERRRIKKGRTETDVRAVLLVGDPGSGKAVTRHPSHGGYSYVQGRRPSLRNWPVFGPQDCGERNSETYTLSLSEI